jgi:hypothetical protein
MSTPFQRRVKTIENLLKAANEPSLDSVDPRTFVFATLVGDCVDRREAEQPLDAFMRPAPRLRRGHEEDGGPDATP